MELRPSVQPPQRGFVIGALIGGGALLASIAVAIIVRAPSDPPPAPPEVTIAPAAPVVVPVPITIAPPPPPPPPPVAPAPIPPPVRATTPYLQAHCVDGGVPDDRGETRAPCDWDDGFPAIARDGKTVAAKHSLDDGGRGYPNLTIDFIDVATSRVTKSVRVLDADEYDPETAKHRAKVVRRAAAVQAVLDAGGYRSLEELAPVDAETGSKLRVETHGSAQRIIDPERNVAIFRADYTPAAAPAPGEGECGGVSNVELWTWWDDATRTVVTTASQTFGGPCWCGGDQVTYVRRLPR